MQRRPPSAGRRPTHPERRRARRPLLIAALALAALTAVPTSASAATLRFAPTADGALDVSKPQELLGKKPWLMVDGDPTVRSYVRFRVRRIAGPVTRATLVLRTVGPLRAPLQVRAVRGLGWREGTLRGAGPPALGRRIATVRRASSCSASSCIVVIDVTRLVRRNRVYDLAIITPHAWQSQRLRSREAGRKGPRLIVRTKDGRSSRAPASATAARAVAGIWTTAAELASRPMAGAAWKAVKAAADGSLGSANISDQDSSHDVNTLAVALVYARTGGASYRAKAAAAIASAIGTEHGGRTLALGRNLASYVIAADLIGLSQFDRALDARFRAWISAVRTEQLDGLTLIETHEKRPNNWGTMAGASRAAVDVYLGDTADLERAFKVFAGWAGDRGAYAGFDYGELSWQISPSQPVGVLPAGAVKSGMLVDGAMPDDMRRGGSFSVPPGRTGYAWEALQGAIVQAMIFSRRGYDAWNVQNRAVLRAVQFVARLDGQFGDWWAASDDEWQPWVINRVYGTRFPTKPAGGPGKIMGWADWTLG